MAKTEDVLKLAKDLIKIESVKTKPEKLQETIDYVKKFLKTEKASIREFNFAKKPSIIVTPKGKTNASLFFLIHLDVVEAEKSQFKPVVKHGKLYGRGAGDMKTNAAIALQVFKETYKNHSVGLIITTDEEMGGFSGAKKLSTKIMPKLVIGTEPSGNGIVVKEKGILWLKIMAIGKSCHSSRPWLGKNAIDSLISDLQKIKKFFRKVNAKNHWNPTVNIGLISGGDTPNKVPDKAEATIDIRYTERFNVSEFLKKLKSLGIDFKVLEKEPLMINQKNNPYILKLLRTFSKNSGRNAKLVSEDGASDGRFFTQLKTPAVMLGIPCLTIHGKEENIKISEIQKYYKTYKEIADQF